MREEEYSRFKSMVMAEVEEHLPRDEHYEILTSTVEKNNKSLDALMIRQKSAIMTPTIYMEDYFKEFLSGRSMTEICREISQIVQRAETPPIQIESLIDYTKVKDKLRLHLVSKENNQRYLEQGPYRLDTMGAVVVYADMGESIAGQYLGTRITDSLLKGYGITENQLFEDALVQTRMNQPFTFQSMGSLVEEMTGAPADALLGDAGTSMYIITNRDKFYGAAVSLYPDTFQKAREMLGEDFYVLPSSVHELLLIRRSIGHTPSELRWMVREVNREQVDPGERLSNEVFEYRGKENQLLQCKIKEREWER